MNTSFNMETSMMFGDTEMFKALNNFNEKLSLGIDMNLYHDQSFFWKSDECSYICFLEVIKDYLYDLNNTKVITRSKFKIYNEIVNEIIDMIHTPIEDEPSFSDIDMCFICRNNKAKINMKCCKQDLCNKCFHIILNSASKCPFCRESI